jgi:hypothetical protein
VQSEISGLLQKSQQDSFLPLIDSFQMLDEDDQHDGDERTHKGNGSSHNVNLWTYVLYRSDHLHDGNRNHGSQDEHQDNETNDIRGA